MSLFGFRLYNPVVGRFLSVDPLTRSYPWYTPYQFAGNKPIWAIDLDGLEEKESTYWTNFKKKVQLELVSALGYAVAVAEDVSGADLPEADPATLGGAEAVEAFQTGETYGHLSMIAVGAAEMAVGDGMMSGGAVATATVAGAEVGIPAAVVGAGVVAHGGFIIVNAQRNLADSKVNMNPSRTAEEVAKEAEIPVPPRGKGSVKPSERDPQRAYTKKQKEQMLENQNGLCAGCKEPKTVDEVDGHHNNRHADGSPTTVEEGTSLCTDCHKAIHRKTKE